MYTPPAYEEVNDDPLTYHYDAHEMGNVSYQICGWSFHMDH